MGVGLFSNRRHCEPKAKQSRKPHWIASLRAQ
jgi:hypothetical protein